MSGLFHKYKRFKNENNYMLKKMNQTVTKHNNH